MRAGPSRLRICRRFAPACRPTRLRRSILSSTIGPQRGTTKGDTIDEGTKQAEGDLASLLAALEEVDRLLILPHNDPDPDAIASSVALQWLLKETVGLESTIGYRGIIGRAENKALVRYLGYPLRLLARGASMYPSLALVDTQPGAGNNDVPSSTKVSVVFDHHPVRDETSAADFSDVRTEFGATSTILTEYCQAVGTELPLHIATALFYGIKTDTMGLGRGASGADVSAYFYLQSRIDVQALVNIERAQVPREYFRGLVTALRSARLYENRLIVSTIDEMGRPDLPAEMADLLLRLKGVNWVVCMGVYDDQVMLSIRTNADCGAGQLVQDIVGDMGSAGGHGVMAAGQILLEGRNPNVLFHRLERRALERLGIHPEASRSSLI